MSKKQITPRHASVRLVDAARAFRQLRVPLEEAPDPLRPRALLWLRGDLAPVAAELSNSFNQVRPTQPQVVVRSIQQCVYDPFLLFPPQDCLRTDAGIHRTITVETANDRLPADSEGLLSLRSGHLLALDSFTGLFGHAGVYFPAQAWRHP